MSEKNKLKGYTIGTLFAKSRRITDAIKSRLVEDAARLNDLFATEQKNDRQFEDYGIRKFKSKRL